MSQLFNINKINTFIIFFIFFKILDEIYQTELIKNNLNECNTIVELIKECETET